MPLSPEAGANSRPQRSVRLGRLLAILLGLLVAQQLLLWRFLDFAPWWLYALAGLTLFALIRETGRVAKSADEPKVAIRVVAVCAAIAFALCLLGGEGGFFYENEDWQVRNSQLFDMIGKPWPYAYANDGVAVVQRGQLGMFLIPAVVGKALGYGAGEVALLVQNAAFLTIVLSMASTLFAGARALVVGLVVILVFSGMDIIGQEIRIWYDPQFLPSVHLERWARGVAYTSHIAQIFWAPHHSVVGWLGATLYLMWRTGKLRLGAVLLFVPLFVLWSPLAVMGLLPFLSHAGVETLRRRELGPLDVLPPALTALISLPSLIYLGAGSAKLGHYFFPMSTVSYVALVVMEVVPYLLAAYFVAARSRLGGTTLVLVAASLLLIPTYQIASNGDFQMRASIPAMFILSIITADVLLMAFARTGSPFDRLVGTGVLAVLMIGSVTVLGEIRRALVHQPAPRVRCDLLNAWKYSEVPIAKEQLKLYVAPVEAFPAWMRPKGYAVVPDVPDPCWTRPWTMPR